MTRYSAALLKLLYDKDYSTIKKDLLTKTRVFKLQLMLMRKGRIISSYIHCGLSSQGTWLELIQAIEKHNPDVYHNNLQTFLEDLLLPCGDTSENGFSLPLTSLKLFSRNSSHFCPFYLRANTQLGQMSGS